MAVTQSSQIVLKILASLINGLDLSSPTDNIALDWTFTLGDGTGAGAANMVWHDQRTLTASATENLDLAGSLISSFGATLTFTKLKALFVRASAGNTNAVQVQRATSNGVPLFLAATDGLQLTPGGIFVFVDPSAAGVTVTAGTGDILTITNSAGSTSVTYDIVVMGAA